MAAQLRHRRQDILRLQRRQRRPRPRARNAWRISRKQHRRGPGHDRPDDRGELVAPTPKEVGKLPPPAQVQRAVFIAVLSFLFFLAMMIVFYIRQSMLYFLLATAFLIVY